MAQFYAEIQGRTGRTTRVGTKDSGIWSHTRGWNLGVEVQGRVNADGEDEFTVRLTSGSRMARRGKEIGIFTEKDLP